MDIKDYLHLYLGQVMRYTGEGRPFRGTSAYEILSIDNFELMAFSNQRKLVLRTLESLTEEEMIKIFHMPIPKENHTIKTGNEFRQLLALGVDLFGLIDAGLAIDKNG